MWWNWFFSSHETFYSVFVKVSQTSVNRQSLPRAKSERPWWKWNQFRAKNMTLSLSPVWTTSNCSPLPCVCMQVTNRRTDHKHKMTNIKLWFISQIMVYFTSLFVSNGTWSMLKTDPIFTRLKNKENLTPGINVNFFFFFKVLQICACVRF